MFVHSAGYRWIALRGQGVTAVVAPTIAFLLILFGLFGTPLLAQNPVRYFYDDVGRLVKVIDQNGNVATYSYDAMGNLLSIARSTLPANGLALLSFTPHTGPVGQTVTIQGQGFSTTLSSNTVSFNGTPAAVTAATSTTLTVTVPAAAITGLISVTVGSSSASSDTAFTVAAGPVVSITVTPSSASMFPTSQQQFIATGTYANGTQQNITNVVTWSSNPVVASISNTPGTQGLVTANGGGGTTVTASSGGVSGTASVGVSSFLVINVTAPGPTIPLGATEQFTASGETSDGTFHDLTATATWFSTFPTAATVSSASGSQGQVTAVHDGTTNICARLPANPMIGCDINLTVVPVLTSVSVTPSNASLPKGVTQQFTATGSFNDGTQQNQTTAVTWSSSNPAAVSISNAQGSQGIASAVALGTSTISATLGSISNSNTVTITAAAPSTLAVNPSTVSLHVGNTQQLSATITLTDGTTQDATQTATWSTSDSTVATISTASGRQGLVTGVAAGTATITATSGSLSSTAVVIVKSGNATAFLRFLFSGNSDGSISTYGFTNATGQLRLNGYLPGLGANVFALDPAQKFLLAAGSGPSSAVVSVYSVNQSNGSLTQVSGSPFAISGVNPYSIVVDPSDRFVYVGYRNSSQVSGFALDATTGALTPLPGSPYTTAGETAALLVHPSGQYLFVTNYIANAHGSVSVFVIDQTSGALTEITGSPFVTGVSSLSLGQDPAGKYLLVLNQGQNFGSSLRPLGFPGNTDGLEADARRRRGSSQADATTAGIQAWWPANASPETSTSVLRRVGPLMASLNLADALPFTGSGLFGDLRPAHVVHLFFQSDGISGPCISVFSVNATTGALTEISGSPFTSPNVNTSSSQLLVNPGGQYVYTGGSNDFAGFAFSSGSGTLAELSGSPFAAPYTYYSAWDPTGQFLYAAGQSAQTGLGFIQGLSLNPGTGSLTALTQAPARSLTPALAISSGSAALSYLPQFAFVASGQTGANGISAYSISSITGSLSTISGSPFPDGLSPVFAASATSGNFLYVVNQCSEPTCTESAGSVSAYAIDPNAGSLTAVAGSPFVAGGSPRAIAFDPSGLFAYVINDQDGTVSIYAVDPSSGALAAISGSPFAASSTGSIAAAIDPVGARFLVAAKCASCGNGSLYIYGLYEPNLGQWYGFNQTLTLGAQPTALAVDPAGSFAFVTDGASNSVYAFSQISGFAAQVTGSPFAAGQNPAAITVDPTGRFAYVANQASNTVSAYTIDPVLGALTLLAGSPFQTGTSPNSVTVDYSGDFLYVVNSGDSTVSAFSIDPVSGALTPVSGSPFPTGAAAVWITGTGTIQ